MQRNFSKADSDTWIEGYGIVLRLLPDERSESRHQRFVVDLRNGQTMLISHNVGLARHVPVGIGDKVRFRGLYEWNDLGGILHWTHHDPLGVEDGGYVRLGERTYR